MNLFRLLMGLVRPGILRKFSISLRLNPVASVSAAWNGSDFKTDTYRSTAADNGAYGNSQACAYWLVTSVFTSCIRGELPTDVTDAFDR